MRPHSPRKSVSVLALTTQSVTCAIADALRRAFGANAKAVARASGSNIETARNWLDARNAPNVTMFLRLARECPELKAEIRRWLDLDAANDPETERLLTMLVTQVVRHRDLTEIAKGGADAVVEAMGSPGVSAAGAASPAAGGTSHGPRGAVAETDAIGGAK